MDTWPIFIDILDLSRDNTVMENDANPTRTTTLDLIEAALSSNQARVKSAGGDLTRLWMEAGAESDAKKLRQLIRRKSMPVYASGMHETMPVDNVSRLPLMEEEAWPTSPAILNASSGIAIDRFIKDIENAEALRQNGLLSRFGLMLSGPPGTGKTLLAGHISAKLGRPFYIVRLDSLISSRLGETAKNVRQIFDFAPSKNAVLFLDEMDAIAKVRDDKQEVGELKRVVNTVIQGLDSLDDRAVVIAATNHPKMLDGAIWRRFPYHCSVGLPDFDTRADLWKHYLYQDADNLLKRSQILSALSAGFSGADIETIALATRRLSVLSGIDIPEPQLMQALLHSDPPNLVFPETKKLQNSEKLAIARRAVQSAAVTKSHLASMLRVSRQTIHNYISEPIDV